MSLKRRPEELYTALSTLRTLRASGFELFPLGIESKLPRDKEWNLRDYADWDAEDWLKKGGNVAVRARRSDLFVDVDPRNGGDVSLEALLWDLDIPSLEAFPLVRTGSGGRHFYMQVPEGERWRHTVREYPGIDFQFFGRYVVAPGSIHPDTHKPYVLEPPLIAFKEESKLFAPEALQGLLRKPERPTKSGEGGLVSCPELADLLSNLDAADFGQGGPYHGEWLDIAMACHEATNGEGLDEWLEWCASDPRYGDDARLMNTARWDSFDSTRLDGVTYKTLLMAVSRAGNRKAVARLGSQDDVKDDFPDDTLERINDPSDCY